MRKIIITALMLSLFSFAQPAQAGPMPDVTMKVSGLVCDFCARAIEKVFMKQEAVKAVNVDLDNGKVTLDLKPGKTIDDNTLAKLMNDSGYTVTGIEHKSKDKT